MSPRSFIDDAEVLARARDLVVCTAVQTQQEWMLHQLRERVQACAVPDVCSPVRSLRHAWEQLEAYHVFEQPEYSDAERNEFQRKAEEAVSEAAASMVRLEERFMTVCQRESENATIEHEVLLRRLLCTDENQRLAYEKEMLQERQREATPQKPKSQRRTQRKYYESEPEDSDPDYAW